MHRLGLSEFVQLASVFLGFVVGVLVWVLPRLGPGSGWLGAYVLISSAAVGVLAYDGVVGTSSSAAALGVAYHLLILASPAACLHVFTTLSVKDRKFFRGWLWIAVAFCLLGPVVVAAGVLSPELSWRWDGSQDALVLPRWTAYFGGVYYLLASIWILVNSERLLRSAREDVLWEIKFLGVGLALLSAFAVYVSSRVLLYSTLPLHTFRLLPFAQLLSFLLFLVAWYRGSGQVRVTVSHGLVYGSITLFTVGIYLVASSALATWLGKMIPADLELQTIFMVAAVVFLVAVLISRTFRFKLRHWIRRNVYSGKHDYRTSWLQATEGILATDRPERIAEVLGRLAQRSLGVLRVSVWLRVKQGDSCRLAHFCGRHPAGEESIDGVLRVLAEVGLPVSRSELREASLANDARKLVDLMDEKQVSLCVPLCSGEEVLGFLLVGADRQESEFGFDDREFLRVLATHAAGELHVQELLATQLEAKEAEAFNYFSTFLLHDLKNYSSTLRLIAGNAGRHIGNLEFQKDAFESVRQTAEKMTRLCNSLSTFSTNLAEHRKPEDLNRLMRSVVEELGAAVSARLRLELADLPLLSLDAEALTTVLRNLILNAFEAIDPEEGAILVTTRSSGSGTVELSVEDNGSGISREFLEKKLFSPFHTTKSAGLGVGLFHSKKIVEAHGGSIRVESEDGKGTVVTVQLPVPDDVPSERPSSRRQLQ